MIEQLKEGAYCIDATGAKRGPVGNKLSKSGWWDYRGSNGFFNEHGESLANYDPSLVSECSPAPQQFGDLTDADKGALLLAQHQGKVIQEFNIHDVWQAFGYFPRTLSKYGIYRVKPDRITGSVEVVDGKPDFNTWEENK